MLLLSELLKTQTFLPLSYTYRYDEVEEIKRLQALLSYNILDTPPQEEFDSLVRLVSLICDSPIAIISMIDDKRQWYKAKVGLSQNEVPREETFCQYTLQQDDVMEVRDARNNEKFKYNPNVTEENGIRFYAGVNLKDNNGHKIGTVCVVDNKPRELNEKQKQALRLVADQTMILLEARKKNQELKEELEEIITNKVRETQRQLLQKKTEYNAILRAIKRSNAVVEFSPEGVIRTANDNFLNLIGYSREELIGKQHSLLLDEHQKMKSAEFWSSLKKGNFHSGKLKRQHKNGSSVWIRATYNPITDEQNNVLRVIKIAQDITTEIEAEKALKKSKELAEKLNIQKDNFIANMSHEIRTPIHAILGFTELLLEQEKEAVKKSYLHSIKTAGDNLLYIINDILDLSKIEAGIIQLEKEPFDLIMTIDKVFSILHLKAHQKKISFNYHVSPGMVTHLIGDKNRLIQILINLLGNAIKFTSTGSVDLYVTHLERQQKTILIKFKIIDTGIGIPKDKKVSIFDRFTQAEEDTSRNFGGTGLGLNISQQLIERQGGSIRVKSELGKGSVFTFELPFGIAKAEFKHEMERPASQGLGRKKGNILLCEDNDLNQKLISAILSAKGYKVDLAENGKKGVDLLQRNSYDLILMDIQMPVMDGYETTLKIREEIKSTVPIIALTANFLLLEKTKCLQMGMNDYLAKPFTKEEILDRVDAWITVAKSEPERTENKVQDGILSLRTLEELSGGDKHFQAEIIILFIEQAEKMLAEAKNYAASKDVQGIKATAHKMKTSFGIIGAEDRILNELENISGIHYNSSRVEANLSSLENQLNEIFSTLKEIVINAPKK